MSSTDGSSMFVWDCDVKTEGMSKEEMYKKKIVFLEQELASARQQIVNMSVPKVESAKSRYWTEDEHARFLEALTMFGAKDVKSISNHVGTRNSTQVRTHSQKYFLRLEREKKKEGEQKKANYEQEHFERFSNAMSATFHEQDIMKRVDIIKNNYMPDVPREIIRSWVFVHTKTIETFQRSEVLHAANSVGTKRVRGNSNTVLSRHRGHMTRSHFSQPPPHSSSFQPNSFIPTANVRQSAPQYFANAFNNFSPTIEQNQFHCAPTNSFTQEEQQRRPNSEPIFFTFSNAHPYSPSAMMGLEHDLKPYIPGAPPPSTPAPPPPYQNFP